MPAPLPAGDPAKSFWTYADIAVRAGLAEVTTRRRMAEWFGQGFPQPLPWSKRELRWHTATVLAWFARRETAVMATQVQLALVQGGRNQGRPA